MLDASKQAKFEECVRQMLELLGENTSRDGLLDTPKRVAKALSFMTSGYN